MKVLSRVVWSEGMYLAPHHFQAQSRYFEDSIQFAISQLWFKPYGIAGCTMDTEALKNGTAALLSARGMMPDGLPFSIPEPDQSPRPRAVADVFSPLHDSQLVLLSVGARQESGRNFIKAGEGSGNGTRFLVETRPVFDETTGRDEKQVELGQKNFRLLLESEVTGSEVTLPIARIRRNSSGQFVYDPDFIPPCVQIGASESLLLRLRTLISLLEDRAEALGTLDSGRRRSGSYSSMEAVQFWFRHTLHMSLPALRHLALARSAHPEQVYAEMSRLGGALCSFTNAAHPRELPLYDHDRLEDCWTMLERHIRNNLDIILPTNWLEIPLAQAEPYFWTGEVKDQRALDKSRWIIGIRSTAGEAEVMRKAPQLVKFCSRLFVPELVKRAIPGLTLTHLPVPPPAIPAKVDVQYFSIAKAGPCWQHIVQTREVGVYVPDELPDPELDLLIVLE